MNACASRSAVAATLAIAAAFTITGCIPIVSINLGNGYSERDQIQALRSRRVTQVVSYIKSHDYVQSSAQADSAGQDDFIEDTAVYEAALQAELQRIVDELVRRHNARRDFIDMHFDMDVQEIDPVEVVLSKDDMVDMRYSRAHNKIVVSGNFLTTLTGASLLREVKTRKTDYALDLIHGHIKRPTDLEPINETIRLIDTASYEDMVDLYAGFFPQLYADDGETMWGSFVSSGASALLGLNEEEDWHSVPDDYWLEPYSDLAAGSEGYLLLAMYFSLAHELGHAAFRGSPSCERHADQYAVVLMLEELGVFDYVRLPVPQDGDAREADDGPKTRYLFQIDSEENFVEQVNGFFFGEYFNDNLWDASIHSAASAAGGGACGIEPPDVRMQSVSEMNELLHSIRRTASQELPSSWRSDITRVELRNDAAMQRYSQRVDRLLATIVSGEAALTD